MTTMTKRQLEILSDDLYGAANEMARNLRTVKHEEWERDEIEAHSAIVAAAELIDDMLDDLEDSAPTT